MSKKKPKQPSNTIVQNKKARFDYFVKEEFEAGLVLEGWEVKALRAGKVQLVDSYVLLKNGEAFLLGSLINPLSTTSTHFVPDPQRTRKLLLNQRELGKLHDAVQKSGQTCVCLRLYWKNHLVKATIAIAEGKQKHDKRAAEKDRDWNREKQRVVRNFNK
ncbi:MAG: SsrA-binding protein SmpB [Pseudomonadota bacterium]